MNRLLTAVLLVTSLHVLADDLIEFQDGDVIRAEDFNHNFEELEADIANIPAGPQGPAGAAGPQGPAGAAGPQGAAGVSLDSLRDSVTQVSAFCGGAAYCDVSCPIGKIVISGSCRGPEPFSSYLTSSSTWRCEGGDVLEAFAICL